MNNTIAKYRNGNYQVIIKEDGTKYRIGKDEEFLPIRPETIDMNISYRCANRCAICYIDATPTGEEATLDNLIKIDFHPGMEVALNLNSLIPVEFEFMLMHLHKCGVIVNLTINSLNLKRYQTRLLQWQEDGLIHGIGISLDNGVVLYTMKIDDKLKNIVWHTVNGWHTYELINKLPSSSKVLILGYKNKGRAKSLLASKQDVSLTIDELGKLMSKYAVVSFDNLALEQTGILETISTKDRELRYMGEEGSFSMYIDLVHMTYSKSSTDDVNWPINNKTINEMFSHVRGL